MLFLYPNRETKATGDLQEQEVCLDFLEREAKWGTQVNGVPKDPQVPPDSQAFLGPQACLDWQESHKDWSYLRMR